MKTVAILALICMSACANSQLSQPQIQPLDDSFYNPPNTTDVVVNDGHDTQALALNEIAVYETSLNNIERRMRDERLAIMMCGEVHAIDCIALRKQICSIIDLIDSRGGIHHKPYCPAGKSAR